MPIIEIDNITKEFHARQSMRAMLGRGGLSDLLRGRKAEHKAALKDISFSVEPGESLGIIGANGSGKSTLLKILAGVTLPTKGHVTVRGRVASLLELGAGFHPMLTGRENVYLNAGLLGMRHAQVDKLFDEIVEFSGIGDFIDEPVDTYSSGMYVRIGFSVASHVNPDIFLIDEVLSVGDEEFQRKCRTRIGELKEQGKTIIFVSHDLSIVNTLCDRVILLNKGEMVVRDTPQHTTDYYLRQVGREKGVHRIEHDGLEAIANHGRISLFYDKHEVSAPSGFNVQLLCMEQWHYSMSDEWEVEERGPTHCTARGRMARLPAYHVWELRIEGGRLVWKLSIECERDITVDMIEVNLFLPKLYIEWLYGEYSGRFPEILPEDLNWALMTAPDLRCRETAVLPSEGAAHPAVRALLEPHKHYIRVHVQNTPYITGYRVIQAGGRIPDADRPLCAGVHEFMTLTIDLESTLARIREDAAARAARYTLQTGDLVAMFHRGRVHLTYGGAELTEEVDLYSAVFVGNLWHESQNLQWSEPERNGDRLTIVGESRRLPYRQHWQMAPVDNGFSLKIDIEVLEPIEVQEYHVSVGLKTLYDRWETDYETGTFPDVASDQHDWRHVNRDYRAGKAICAFCPSLPSVCIKLAPDMPEFSMTAINAAYHQQARVIQALRTPEHGPLQFAPGWHPFFAGAITVEALRPQ